MTRLSPAAALMGLLAHCAPACAAGIEIVGALGRKVMVEHPVHRVVVNFNFETFAAVAGKAGWSKVVGVPVVGVPVVVVLDDNAQWLDRHLASTRCRRRRRSPPCPGRARRAARLAWRRRTGADWRGRARRGGAWRISR